MSQWSEEDQKAFVGLKVALCSSPILRCADPNEPYEVATDALQTVIGVVLTQTVDQCIRPVSYASRKLSPTEQGYATNERKLLGIFFALETWRSFLHAAKSVILIDHNP